MAHSLYAIIYVENLLQKGQKKNCLFFYMKKLVYFFCLCYYKKKKYILKEEFLMNISLILEKLLNINPISAVSIMFALLFLWHSKRSMQSLEKIHQNAVKEIKEAYGESMKILKEFVENLKNKK